MPKKPNKQPKRHAHSVLIDRLGWPELRAAFNLKRERLHNWRAVGIPWTHRPAIADYARARGIELPDDFLTPPPPSPNMGRPQNRNSEAA